MVNFLAWGVKLGGPFLLGLESVAWTTERICCDLIGHGPLIDKALYREVKFYK